MCSAHADVGANCCQSLNGQCLHWRALTAWLAYLLSTFHAQQCCQALAVHVKHAMACRICGILWKGGRDRVRTSWLPLVLVFQSDIAWDFICSWCNPLHCNHVARRPDTAKGRDCGGRGQRRRQVLNGFRLLSCSFQPDQTEAGTAYSSDCCRGTSLPSR